MFLLLSQVRDFFKTLETKADFYYIGKLDGKKDKSIGVYQRQGYTNDVLIGLGNNPMSYKILPISILIHYNKNAKETEIFANKIYSDLFNLVANNSDIRIDDFKINFIKLYQAPIDVGTDDNGVYERVIELDFYYSEL